MSKTERETSRELQVALDRLLPQMPPEIRERLFADVPLAELPMYDERGWYTRDYHGFALAVWRDIVWARRPLLLQMDRLDDAVRHRVWPQVERYDRHRSGADRWPGGYERIDQVVQRLRTTGALPQPLICVSSMGKLHLIDGLDELVGFEWHYTGLASATLPAIDAWVGEHVEGSGRR